MTKTEYGKYHDIEHPGRHEKKWYQVWRAKGPAGPEEFLRILGREEAKQAVKGYLYYAITDMNGRVIL